MAINKAIKMVINKPLYCHVDDVSGHYECRITWSACLDSLNKHFVILFIRLVKFSKFSALQTIVYVCAISFSKDAKAAIGKVLQDFLPCIFSAAIMCNFAIAMMF